MTTAGEAGGTGSLTGFYFREARFLSTVRLEIDGERLWLCEAASISHDQLQFVYTYPEVAVYEGGGSGQAGDEEPRNHQGIPQRGIAAQQLMGVLCWMTGARADARAWFSAAADLKERFNRDWWLEDSEFVALALDPGKSPVRAATSNVGHCLATGIIDAEHVPAVVGRLFAPDMFSGWGIRTLSADHRYYNPLSYHRGTVWAVEQATTIFGLRRFGFTARANDLARALFDLAALYPEHRIPECVGGYPRATHRAPGAYPQANAPQLWNATAFPLTVQTLAGIVPLAPYDTLIVDPALPDWLPELVFQNLRVGGATATLRFWRDACGQSKFQVLHKRGTLHVVRQPPPESLSADLWQRLHGVMESVA